MRLPIIRLVLAPLLIIAANTAYATTVVYPTGVYPTDLNNVQSAVNAGGSILLKATNTSGVATSFNFAIWNAVNAIPPNSGVTLNANVAITGETVAAGRTTILGGCVPFYGANFAAKASINNIKFVTPQGAAIAIFKSAGITITNNEIVGTLKYADAGGNVESSGMYISGVSGTTVTGPVVVSGNYIHGLDGTYELGIGLFDLGPTATIIANTIVIGDATDAGSGSRESEGIAIFNSNGATIISGNNVQIGSGTGQYGIAAHGPQTGAVTITANQVSIAEGATSNEAIGINGSTGKVQIIGNLLTVNNLGADGISLSGNQYVGGITGATVAANIINLEYSYVSAIELSGSVANSSISLNLITGSANYGISAQNSGQGLSLSGNNFLSNQYFAFSVLNVDVFFDTTAANNLYIGQYSSDIDNGTGDTIIQ